MIKIADHYKVTQAIEHPNYFAIVECKQFGRFKVVAYATTRSQADKLVYSLNKLKTIEQVCYPSMAINE